MRFDATGHVDNELYVAGTAGAPIYLFNSDKPVIFDAGNTCLSHLYIEDIKKYFHNRPPGYLFITHSHFDHIGAAASLKKMWPDLKIAASEKTRAILKKPSAVKVIRDLNIEAAKELLKMGFEVDETPFESFDVDIAVEPGMTFDIGAGNKINAIASPGHTWDFLSYWIPEKRILIASESVGIDNGAGHIFTEFLVDYDAYMTSLKQLAQLRPDIVCPGHRLVLTGVDAALHLKRAPEMAEDYLKLVEECLREENGHIEKAALKVKRMEWDPEPWPKQPEGAYWLNTIARITSISDRMSSSEADGRTSLNVS